MTGNVCPVTSYHDVTLGSNIELTVRQAFVNIILVVGIRDITQYHLTSRHKKLLKNTESGLQHTMLVYSDKERF